MQRKDETMEEARCRQRRLQDHLDRISLIRQRGRHAAAIDRAAEAIRRRRSVVRLTLFSVGGEVLRRREWSLRPSVG